MSIDWQDKYVVDKIVAEAIGHEEADRKHFTEILQHALALDDPPNHVVLHLYQNAGERQRAIIDEVFLALCRNSLPQLAAKAIRRANGMALTEAFAPDAALAMVALRRLNRITQ